MQKPETQNTRKSEAFWIFAAMLAVMVWLVSGCDPANNDSFTPDYVVQGNMYVGHAPELRLTRTVSPGSPYIADQVGVSNADVTFFARNDSAQTSLEFHLVEQTGHPGGSGYYGLAATDTLTLLPGWHYGLRAIVGSDTISATTTAAGFMNFTQPASDTDTTVIVFGIDQFVMRWQLEPRVNRGYWAIFENLNPHHGDDSCWLAGNAGGPDKRIGQWNSFWNAPPTADSMNTPWILFRWDGLYRVRVFSCDTAFWFWSSSWAEGQAENYPVTNIKGGIGVFTVGGVDTTYFYMAKNPNIHD